MCWCCWYCRFNVDGSHVHRDRHKTHNVLHAMQAKSGHIRLSGIFHFLFIYLYLLIRVLTMIIVFVCALDILYLCEMMRARSFSLSLFICCCFFFFSTLFYTSIVFHYLIVLNTDMIYKVYVDAITMLVVYFIFRFICINYAATN